MLFDQMSVVDAPVGLLRRTTKWAGKQAHGWMVGTVHADQALLVADSTGYQLCLQSGSSTSPWSDVDAIHISEALEARIVDSYASQSVCFATEPDLHDFQDLARNAGVDVKPETEPPSKRPRPPRYQPAVDVGKQPFAHQDMRSFSAQSTIVTTRWIGILLTVVGIFVMGYNWPGLDVDADGALVIEGNAFWLGVGAIMVMCGQGAVWFGIIADAVKFGIRASREE